LLLYQAQLTVFFQHVVVQAECIQNLVFSRMLQLFQNIEALKSAVNIDVQFLGIKP